MGKQRATETRAKASKTQSHHADPEKVGRIAKGVIGFYSDMAGNPYREFSNFYRHDRPFEFTLPGFAQRDGFPTSVWCSFSEKAIMETKAALMGDLEILREIDKVDDPKSCKALGRGVRNFDDELWKRHLEQTAFEVVRQKFESQKGLRDLLLSTGNSILAEAAPNDCIWGIGLRLTDSRVKDPSQWCGRNILGTALMQTRDHLRGCDPGITADALSVEQLPSNAVAAVERLEEVNSAIESRPIGQAAASSSATAIDVAAAAAPQDEQNRYSRRWGKSKVGAGPPPDERMVAEPTSASKGLAAAAPHVQTGSEQLGLICDCFAVLDFEATCDDKQQPRPQEVIELPIVLVDAQKLSVVSEFRTYVRPLHHPLLTAFCTQLTGIQQQQVDDAPDWHEALAQAQAWMDNSLAEFGFKRCLFVTCGDWDLGSMIAAQCATSGQHVPERFKEWLNIKNLFKSLNGRPGRSMKQMLEELRLPLAGRHHSGLDDSRNIANILVTLLRRGIRVEEDMLSHHRDWRGR